MVSERTKKLVDLAAAIEGKLRPKATHHASPPPGTTRIIIPISSIHSPLMAYRNGMFLKQGDDYEMAGPDEISLKQASVAGDEFTICFETSSLLPEVEMPTGFSAEFGVELTSPTFMEMVGLIQGDPPPEKPKRKKKDPAAKWFVSELKKL